MRAAYESYKTVAAELESAPREQRDDLKMIKGVGPAIEKTLNEMGIFNFQQIAEMNVPTSTKSTWPTPSKPPEAADGP